MKTYFQQAFESSLDKLAAELEQTTDENRWKTANGVTNSCGTLFLHLIGNVNHFIGSQLGNTGYVRQRDKEFADRDVPKAQVAQAIADAKQIVTASFSALPEEKLSAVFPLNTFGEGKATSEVLLILLGHFQYHLGQINYLRRVLNA